MATETIFNSAFGEQRWVEQISEDITQEIANIPVSIFNVPKTLNNPEAYIPRVIALGPYHHFDSQLYPMERYKLAAVKSFLNPDQILNFQHLVIDQLKTKDSDIRACYHKYIDFDDTTLAWIFAVDGFFLLRILSNYAINGTTIRKLTHEAVLLRDVLLLENQVPFVVLKQLRETFILSSTKSNDDDDDDDDKEEKLVSMLIGFCQEQSPLPIMSIQQVSHLHLLDVMYHLIVNRTDTNVVRAVEESVRVHMGEELTENLEEMVEVGGKFYKPLQVVHSLPWQKIFNLLGLKLGNTEVDDKSVNNEEITIPSVTQLNEIGGIIFSPAKGGISEIKFVEKEVTFYLPVLNLNSNTEVILRNLVAYEDATSESTFELAQYISLMSGIIDTAEDADMLIQQGIITGNLKGNEIVDLFNGMNDIRGRQGSRTINDINAYFSKKPKVKVYNVISKQIYSSWKFLTVFTTVVIILLMVLQSFCDVYGCPQFFGR